jgi:hypothetical protein
MKAIRFSDHAQLKVEVLASHALIKLSEAVTSPAGLQNRA